MKKNFAKLVVSISAAAIAFVALSISCASKDSSHQAQNKSPAQWEKMEPVNPPAPNEAPPTREQQIAQHLADADVSAKNFDHQAAIRSLDEALKLDPNNDEAAWKKEVLGDAVRSRRDYVTAGERFVDVNGDGQYDIALEGNTSSAQQASRQPSVQPYGQPGMVPGVDNTQVWYDVRNLSTASEPDDGFQIQTKAVKPGIGGGRFQQGGGGGGGGGEGGGLFGDDGQALWTPAPNRLPTYHSDELWIIQKFEPSEAATPNSDAPGTGSLLAKLPNETKTIPVPLKHTDVKAHISAYIATVDVTQKYENPFDAKIEAVYVFPLPENAAINEFIMTIGDRSIRGIIRERKEAEQVYREARAQGHVASLLTQERANVFTQKVANIEPGKAIDINIKYLHTLAYDDGWYEYVFPMVVGPRYNPPNTTNGIDAVARGQAPNSNQSTAVEYLKPTERSGHDIALTLDIDAGVAVEQVRSMNHTIETKTDDANRTNVRLAALDSIPNKDFVLRYKVAGERVKSALLTHESDKGKYFSLMLFPPAEIASLPRAAMEMIFVIDCSGSMNGKPIEQAKAAVEYALKHLRADDTFQIVQFSSTASQFGASPVAANLENINKGVQYVRNLNGEGGTEMLNGIRAALDFPHDDNRLRFVSFLTDGFIGNESDILANIHAKLGSSRIFSFGVGSAPNRFLMDRMAVLGRGAAAYLSLNDNGGEVMDRFFAKISHPAMTDVALDFGGMQVEDVYPSRVPDLFVGRPIVVTGRYRGEGTPSIQVSGRAGAVAQSFYVNADSSASGRHDGLAAVWARMKIAELADRSTYEGTNELPQEITQLALAHSLMSSFTAFVAVDSLSQTAGTVGTTVHVQVPVPDGVKYETTVGQ